MIKYVVKKIVKVLLIIIGISFLSFFLLYLAPSDAAEIMLTKTGTPPTEELLEKTREEMGLNKPMLVQYGSWFKKLCKGDMGTSFKSKKSVIDELIKVLPNTLWLTIVSTIVTVLISTPLGILCAKYKDSMLDNIVRVITYLFVSLPTFFTSLVLLYILALKSSLFPVIGDGGTRGIIMPIIVLSLSLSAWHIRQVRAIILKELENDYVLGARSRGVPEKEILIHHVLRNSLIPIITLIGVSFGSLLGGSIIVESIFTWPGIGRLAVDAISNRDYPIIQGYVLLMALIFLFVNSLVELSYLWIDPRVRKGKAR